MAKFKFRLQTLLRIREQERDERQSELAEAQQADQILVERQEEVAAQITVLGEENRRCMVGTIDVDRILGNRRHEALLLGHQREIAEQRRIVGEEIQKRQERLVEANREVKVLEKLREKQEERFREEERLDDIKQMDEIAGRRREEGVV